MDEDFASNFGDLDFRLVLDITKEPCYKSEIARKMREARLPKNIDTKDGVAYNEDGTRIDSEEDVQKRWSDVSETGAVRLVSGITNLMMGVMDNRLAETEIVYDEEEGAGKMESQREGSIHLTFDEVGIKDSKQWKNYKIVMNDAEAPRGIGNKLDEVGLHESANRLREVVDASTTVEDKIEIVRQLSRLGNTVSQDAETIMQDVLHRQFADFDHVRSEEYNDPGVDFFVQDKGRKKYGLCVEVSTRWVNPIHDAYIDGKKDKAFDLEADLLVMAPNFTGPVEHDHPVGQQLEKNPAPVGLAQVPDPDGDVYYPFATSRSDLPDEEKIGGGTPVIVPDEDRVRKRMKEGAQVDSFDGTDDTFDRVGRVGWRYPVATDVNERLADMALDVGRNVNVITESRFRNAVREAIEPFLPEFTKPYRVEQYLIDTYWKEGKIMSEIAEDTGVTRSTIGNWMSEERWDIITRGVQGERGDDIDPLLSREVAEIWKKMYLGEEPFDEVGRFTGYDIQSYYSRFPMFKEGDWRRWFDKPKEERKEIMTRQDSGKEELDYTIMLGHSDRLAPSYQFILEVLRRVGVEIREGIFSEIGSITPTRKSMEYMINRDLSDVPPGEEAIIRQMVRFRSTLEVEFGEWLSDEEIPFAYEPFVIPGVMGASRGEWERRVEDIKSGGDVEATNIWRQIYNKHKLDEYGDVDVQESLERFNKTQLEPDYATYPQAEDTQKDRDWEGWGDWGALVELVGAWGMGKRDNADWTSWYRVSNVAYKELMYKLLGLWEDTYFVVQNAKGLTDAIRSDPHYYISNITTMDPGLEGFERVVGR